MEEADARIVLKFVRLTLDHPAAQAAAAELLTDLRSEAELRARQQDGQSGSGAKGATTEIVVSLATSGSLASLARILQVWLNRDRRRSLTVEFKGTQDHTIITIEGEQISADVLAAAIKSAAPGAQSHTPADVGKKSRNPH